MSAIQKFREVTKVLNELSTAAVSARSEVQKLLTVLEGPAPIMSNITQKKFKSSDQWCGEPDCAKYEWRMQTNTINTWAEPQNATGNKVNEGLPPPPGSW